MKATLPCNRPRQLSLFGSPKSSPDRHHWEKGICIHCGIHKSESVVTVCDCGCKTPIYEDTLTTHYGKLVFIFGHETLNIFDEVRIVSSVAIKLPKSKLKKKRQKKIARRKRLSSASFTGKKL